MLKVLNDPSFIHEVVKLKDELQEFDKTEYNIIEIIDDGKDGLLVDRNNHLAMVNAVVKLMDNPILNQSIIKFQVSAADFEH